MEALIVNPIIVEKPWGIENKNKHRIGEEWILSLNEDKITTFANYNLNLEQIFNNTKKCTQILGKRYIKKNLFPVIIKKLYVDGQLSIQIHPTNKVARTYENSMGKSELWYILQTDNKTLVNMGIKNKIKTQKVRQLIREGIIEEYLNTLEIKKDDIINIPAGTIHSINGRAVVYEIQQNSDITYRIKDVNGRNLDLDKASKAFIYKKIKIMQKEQGNIINNRNYKLNKLKIVNSKNLKTNNTFKVITVIQGKGILNIDRDLKIYKGMTLLIPACVKQYQIKGNLEILMYN